MSNNKPNRYVNDVIKQVLNLIPASETKLISELQIYNSLLWNKPPEVLQDSYCWEPFINILNRNIPEINTVWQVAIKNIISNNI